MGNYHNAIIINDKTGVVQDYETTDNGNAAWEQHRRIQVLKRGIEGAFLELGRVLYEFKASEGWRVMGHPSFESYLADPEVDVGRRTAYRAMQVHSHYVLRLGCDTVTLIEVGVSKLCAMANHTNAANAGAMLALAASVSRSDLADELGNDPPPHSKADARPEPITTPTAYTEAVIERQQNRLDPARRDSLDAVIETWEAATVAAGTAPAATVCPACGYRW